MSYHSDPTASLALGNGHREWKQMVRKAIWLREHEGDPRTDEVRSRFTGIYRPLLRIPLTELMMLLREEGKEQKAV